MSHDTNEVLSDLKAGKLTRRTAFTRLVAIGVSATAASQLIVETAQAQSHDELSQLRMKGQDVVKGIGPSKIPFQVEFLRGLVNDKDEATRFMKDPSGYSVEHGVVLDPEVVRIVQNTAYFYPGPVRPRNWEPEAVKSLEMMKGNLSAQMSAAGQPAAWPAAVSAAAAVVSAAAAVVTAVTALTSDSRYERLRGVNPSDYRLPGGKAFRY